MKTMNEPIISKDEEIRDLKRLVEKKQAELTKFITGMVMDRQQTANKLAEMAYMLDEWTDKVEAALGSEGFNDPVSGSYMIQDLIIDLWGFPKESIPDGYYEGEQHNWIEGEHYSRDWLHEQWPIRPDLNESYEFVRIVMEEANKREKTPTHP
jgi:hypothetical protein